MIRLKWTLLLLPLGLTAPLIHAQGSACLNVVANGGWVSAPIAVQNGQFTATFDATPSASPIDGLIGFAQGVAKDYTQLSAMVRFNPSGRIDARNGGAFRSSATIPHVAQ